MIYLLLVLGLGLSILLTELSVSLRHANAWLVTGFMFFGYCCALLVGSYSDVTKHPQLYAILLYWAIVSISTAINVLDK